MSFFEVNCKKCGGVNAKLEINGERVRAKCRYCPNSDWLSFGQDAGEFVMPFGKYKGRNIEQICRLDRSYATWVIEKSTIDQKIKDKFLVACDPLGGAEQDLEEAPY